jgi:hypothetical protein
VGLLCFRCTPGGDSLTHLRRRLITRTVGRLTYGRGSLPPRGAVGHRLGRPFVTPRPVPCGKAVENLAAPSALIKRRNDGRPGAHWCTSRPGRFSAQ